MIHDPEQKQKIKTGEEGEERGGGDGALGVVKIIESFPARSESCQNAGVPRTPWRDSFVGESREMKSRQWGWLLQLKGR